MVDDIWVRTKDTQDKIVQPSVYFAHPVNTFNTYLEEDALDVLEHVFPEFYIENPNTPEHQENYQAWKEEFDSGMKYLYDVVLPHMHAGVAMPFEDGQFGKGVYKEAAFLYALGTPVFELSPDLHIAEFVLDDARCLSIEETQERVYNQ